MVGDINPAEAMAGLEKHFGAWQPGEVPAPAITDAPDATRRVIVIDKKDAVQTEIRVGHIAIPRKHNDYEAVDQAIKILGGEGANRLQQVLRSQKQLTYGASADLNTYKWAGAVIAETDTQTSNTAEALRVVVDEFTRLQRERVNDGELEGAQDYMVGHFPLTIEVPGCDCHAGPQPAVLRAAGRRPAALPRARAEDHARRDPARRALVRPAGAAVGGAGRRRRQVRQRSEGRRLRQLRAHSDRAPRPDVGRLPEARRRTASLVTPFDGAQGKRILLSCGEASGDLYAGALVDALRRREPGIEVFGMGGERFAAAGGRLVADFHGLSVTGLTEALSVVPRSFRTIEQLTNAAKTQQPDAAVLIDFPDFNFRLMHRLQRLGIPVVYYISPQLWAWRAGRIKQMKRATRVLPIFPFEEAIYQRAGIDVRFVGHPLIDLATVRLPRDAFLKKLNLDPSKPVLALLPGSRTNELARLAPVIAEAVPMIAARVPGVQFVIARAPNLDDRLFDAFGLSGRDAADRRHPDRRCAECVRRGDHGVRHRDGADRAARQADGGDLQAVADDLPARHPSRPRRQVRDGQPDRRRSHRRRTDPGRVHRGCDRRRGGEAVERFRTTARG